MRTHGHWRDGKASPTYESWRGMKARCKPDRAYGLRGITVCERWRRFENFLEDMGERPDGHELDRIANAKVYGPLTCQWSPKKRNRQDRSTVRLTATLRLCVDQMLKEGVPRRAMSRRLAIPRWTIDDYIKGRSWEGQ